MISLPSHPRQIIIQCHSHDVCRVNPLDATTPRRRRQGFVRNNTERAYRCRYTDILQSFQSSEQYKNALPAPNQPFRSLHGAFVVNEPKTVPSVALIARIVHCEARILVRSEIMDDSSWLDSNLNNVCELQSRPGEILAMLPSAFRRIRRDRLGCFQAAETV